MSPYRRDRSLRTHTSGRLVAGAIDGGVLSIQLVHDPAVTSSASWPRRLCIALRRRALRVGSAHAARTVAAKSKEPSEHAFHVSHVHVRRLRRYGAWLARGARVQIELASSAMPTVRRIGKARFFFYSNEGTEPPHIHVEQAGALAKFWLTPISLASSSRFSGHELRRLEREVTQHRDEFLKAWHEHFES